jgi:hypothetical protein
VTASDADDALAAQYVPATVHGATASSRRTRLPAYSVTNSVAPPSVSAAIPYGVANAALVPVPSALALDAEPASVDTNCVDGAI